MNILPILISFSLCWMLIEITMFLSSKLKTANSNHIPHESFVLSLRILAVALLIGIIVFMDFADAINLKSRIFICYF